MRRLWFCLCVALLARPALAGEQEAVSLQPCTLAAAGGLLTEEAECGWLAVPENPAAPDGKQIKLHIAVVRARTAEAAPDPVFFIAGGPGQSATDGYLALRGAFRGVLAERDIVLLDQRGTGQSNPLTCPPPPKDAPLWPDTATQLALLKQCLTKLPGDPRFYTTSVAVDDLEKLRAALGHEQINLYGISYGTRVAQQYLREYEDHVRSVVLDGVVPATEVLGASMALDAQRALDLMLARCTAETDCATAFPDINTDYQTLLQRLQNSVAVSLRDPVNGELLDIRFGHEQLAQALRLLSYSTETVALLPLLIHSATQGDLTPLAAQAVLTGQELEGALAIGMHNAIVCTEDAPFYALTAAQRAALTDTYMGSLQVDLLQTLCGFWPQGVIAENFKQPVVSDKPVLLLSGAADPVTPPANAEQVATTLSNSRMLVAPGQGHGIANRGCVPRVLADFYTSATPDKLDAGCVAELEPAPFFVRFTGPNP